MKKKLIAIAIAAAVAAPLTAQAIDMSGDARVRYYDNSVSELMGSAAAKAEGAQTDSRIGLNISGADGETAMAKVRLEVVNTHGATADATVTVDHAYISANVGAGVKVTGGKTIANWGHKFYIWDADGDRVSITKSLGDMNFGLHFSKARETGMKLATASAPFTNIPLNADDDNDKSGTHLTFTMGKMGGIRHDIVEDDTAGTKVKTTALYGGAPLPGGWGLGFEFVTSDEGTDNNRGLMLAGMGKVADVALTVGYASAADGYSSDNDFFTFAGTGAEAGAMLPGLMSQDGNKMTGLFVVAGMKAGMVDLEVGAAQIKWDTTNDPKNTVLSIKASHQLSKNSKVIGQYGSFSGDMIDATQMGASIETKF
jgi:hypothetical protein